MKIKIIIFLIIFFFISFLIFYLLAPKEKKNIQPKESVSEDISYSSNIIKDVYYSSKDSKGNEYIIKASVGEIDYKNSDVVYLTDVKGLITLTNSNNIEISSDNGKYNINNFDTIFSKNVKINYLDNKIEGGYLDFSMKRNSMIISRKVVYENSDNILKADVIEIDVTTKDTKIFMYQNNKKINIISNQ